MFLKILLVVSVILHFALPTQAGEKKVIDVIGFAGETLDTMNGTTKNGFAGGLNVDYNMTDDVGLYIVTYHSLRRAEDDIKDVILDAQSIEWKLGVRYAFKELNQGQTALCAIAEGGLVQLLDTPGDVLDDHFIGVGVDHIGGGFAGSNIALGYGKSDVFAQNQNSRFKVKTRLKYTDAALPLSLGVFLSGTADTDLRGGTDGLRINLGALVPFERIFN